jgi:hypothetical protein
MRDTTACLGAFGTKAWQQTLHHHRMANGKRNNLFMVYVIVEQATKCWIISSTQPRIQQIVVEKG